MSSSVLRPIYVIGERNMGSSNLPFAFVENGRGLGRGG